LAHASLVAKAPHSIEAEQAVLGAILCDPANVLVDVADQLRAQDFSVNRHRVIYQAMCDLSLQGAAPDIITLANRLVELGDDARAGGRLYLNELQERSVTSVGLESHVEIIRRKSVLRQLIEIGGQLTELGHDEVTNPQQLLDQATAMILEPSLAIGTTKIEHVGEFADEYLRRVDASVSGSTGLTCGYSTLDSVLFDVRGQIMIIAGLPHAGKTAFSLNMIYRQVHKGIPCGVITLEMTKYNIFERLLQMEGRLTRNRVRYEPGLRRAAAKELCALPLYICEARPKTLPAILRQMRMLVRQCGVQSILVDYVQLVDPPQSERYDIGIGIVVRALLEFAQAHDLCVIAPSQANRDTMAGGGSMPQLWNMKDSAQIEAHADIILGVARPSYRSEKEIPTSEAFDVRILKQRAGLSGRKYQFTFFPGYQRIEERATDAPED
jgi:replicative DNA helicase